MANPQRVLCRLLVPVFLVVAAAAGTSGAAAQPTERAAIAASLAAYQAALSAGRGTEAAEQVSSDTVAYYEHIREQALHGSEQAVRADSLFDRINILTMRHYMGAAELESLDGRGLIARAIDLGLVDKNSTGALELGEVEVTGDEATAVYLYRGQPTPYRLHFVREEGRWRVDLLSFMRIGEPALKAVADKAGVPEDQFILDLLQQVSGRAPADDIWQPLVKE